MVDEPVPGMELAERMVEAATAQPDKLAQLSDQDIFNVVSCYSEHLAVKLPDAGEGMCCIGSAVMGPQACTCWVAVHDLEQQPIRPGESQSPEPLRMCGDCAYRPGSPERSGDASYRGDQELLDRIVADGTPFHCHAGMRHKAAYVHPSGAEVPGHPGGYDPPIVDGVPYKADGTPGDLCAGWLLRTRKLSSPANPPEDA